jgi:uncharacterized protein (TIGR02466 family)
LSSCSFVGEAWAKSVIHRRSDTLDLGDHKIKLDSLWINILPEGGIHTSHIHPHSVISGTTYVAMPKGASAIKFEDPRSARMMASPTRVKDARAEMRGFHYIAPTVATCCCGKAGSGMRCR